jgi:hypothetical protein
MRRRLAVALTLAAAISVMVAAQPAGANHGWGKYHWKREANPVALKIIDSTTGSWGSTLNSVISDWDSPLGGYPKVISPAKENGNNDDSTRQTCPAVLGKIRACNYTYGSTGWLGVAQIWIYVGKDGHIAQGTVKVNESYAVMSNANARRHVLCQEVGHTFGLDHQHAASCMDDANGLTDSNYVSPNAHDFEQLAINYQHLDGVKTKPGKGNGKGQGNGSRPDRSMIVTQSGNFVLVTYIFWA